MEHNQYSESWQFGDAHKGAIVEVKHFVQKGYPRRCVNFNKKDIVDIHHWNVYAYIYPHHPIFKTFTSDNIFQDAAKQMPFHYCCTFCSRHFNSDGKCVSVQVGSDYGHIHDDYEQCTSRNDVIQVFRDAEELIDYLGVLQKEQ